MVTAAVPLAEGNQSAVVDPAWSLALEDKWGQLPTLAHLPVVTRAEAFGVRIPPAPHKQALTAGLFSAPLHVVLTALPFGALFAYTAIFFADSHGKYPTTRH